MFKVVMIGSDGTREEDDEVFETEAAADQHGQQMCSDYSQGATVLHMHNPGDYPDPDDEIDYEIDEVNDGTDPRNEVGGSVPRSFVRASQSLPTQAEATRGSPGVWIGSAERIRDRVGSHVESPGKRSRRLR